MDFASPSGLLFLLLFAAAIVYPEKTFFYVMKLTYEIELMMLNWKLKRMQWKLYKQLCKDAKTIGLPQPPPFKFVRLQDRPRR